MNSTSHGVVSADAPPACGLPGSGRGEVLGMVLAGVALAAIRLLARRVRGSRAVEPRG